MLGEVIKNDIPKTMFALDLHLILCGHVNMVIVTLVLMLEISLVANKVTNQLEDSKINYLAGAL